MLHRLLACVAAVSIASVGCTHVHDVTATFVAPGASGGGALDVVLAAPSGALSVTVNDALVVDRARSRRAHIDAIPPGPARVHVVTGGGCEASRVYDRRVDIVPGATLAIPLPAPEPNTACMIGNGFATVAVALELVASVLLLAHLPHAHRG